jgi:hypothetical protein
LHLFFIVIAHNPSPGIVPFAMVHTRHSTRAHLLDAIPDHVKVIGAFTYHLGKSYGFPCSEECLTPDFIERGNTTLCRVKYYCAENPKGTVDERTPRPHAKFVLSTANPHCSNYRALAVQQCERYLHDDTTHTPTREITGVRVEFVAENIEAALRCFDEGCVAYEPQLYTVCVRKYSRGH